MHIKSIFLLFPDLSANSTSNTVCSLGYPNFYPHNSNYQWNIVAPAGKHIEVMFTDFVIESFYDNVYVRDGKLFSFIHLIICMHSFKYID